MPLDPTASTLGQCSLFGGIELCHCEYFCTRLERVDLVPGEVVYEEGDPAHELFVVASGRLHAFKPSQSANVPLAELLPGEFFGDMSFIDMQPRSATVRAVEPTVLWRMSSSSLREAYLRDLKCYTLVVMNIAREMSRRLRRADYYRTLFDSEGHAMTRTQRAGAASVIGRIGRRAMTLRSIG